MNALDILLVSLPASGAVIHSRSWIADGVGDGRYLLPVERRSLFPHRLHATDVVRFYLWELPVVVEPEEVLVCEARRHPDRRLGTCF